MIETPPPVFTQPISPIISSAKPVSKPTVWDSCYAKISEVFKRGGFLVTHTEPLEKTIKVVYYSISLVKSLGVTVSSSWDNVSTNIKSFNEFSDMLKGVRAIGDWCDFKKMMQLTQLKIANRASLAVAGIFAGARWFDRNLNACLGGISSVQWGKFPILSSAKDALVMLASAFSMCEVGSNIPKAHAKLNESGAHLEKWSIRALEIQNMRKSDNVALENSDKVAAENSFKLAVDIERVKLQSKIHALQSEAEPTLVDKKIQKYTQRLALSDQDFVADIEKQVNFKQRLWSTRDHNAELAVKKNWLSIANDVTKFVAISLVFVIIGASITTGAILVVLGLISVTNNCIGVRKALFEEFDFKLKIEPKPILNAVLIQ